MLDIKRIEEEPQKFKDNLKNRGGDSSEIDRILELNKKRKESIAEAEEKKAELNRVSKEIALMKKNKEDANDKIMAMRELGSTVKNLEKTAAEVKDNFEMQLAGIPNLCHDSVPVGASEDENKLVHRVGEPKKLSFAAKTHDEIGEQLGLLDFDRAAKVTGARFAFLRGQVARLERALAQFMLDTHVEEHGYEEFVTPYMVNEKALFGTGQFPKFKEDVFHIEPLPYHLIPTAEVTLTNYFADEMLSADDLPYMFTAFSPCFRSEAGSHGRDTKGLIRQHQFHKVEMVHLAHPDKSYEMHDKMLGHAESILKSLELPYEVVALCTGDIGFSAAKCYDINVWLPGQDTYREISSCSNCEDFQARRANIRFKEKGEKKPKYVHTLNGSGLAVGRTLLAVLENYQQEDGSVLIPEVLRKYMNGKDKIVAI
ncbi:MAG: serine--tRNA ligase [Bdellovibrionota bacterium]|nr:serine--tRNA ligase [Pseudobdellovibrionaceae bacterium]|tara:strand:- start:80190 stop:81470 length:1281 start_codon:yes stop_codon:yes gene_type:complete